MKILHYEEKQLIEGKKNKTLTLPHFLRLAVVNDIPPRDALLLLTPGDVYEMFKLWAKQHGLERSDE